MWCFLTLWFAQNICKVQNNSLCINMQFLHAHLSGFKLPWNLEAFSQLHEWNLKITLIKYSYIKRARSSFTIWWTSTLLLMKREILTFQTWQWWQTNKRGVWFKLSPPSITWTGVTKVRYRARAIDQLELFCT